MAKTTPPPNTVEVIKTEEKGSDVNFCIRLVNDAWIDNYDCAVLATNNSDMIGAMLLVNEHYRDKKLSVVILGSSFSNRIKTLCIF